MHCLSIGTSLGASQLPPMFPFLETCDDPNALGSIGPYHIEVLIGEGATCYVFAGKDPKLQRRVAVRVLKPTLNGNAAARALFNNENRASSQVEHPNVLPVYAICENSEYPYAVLAHCEGKTLGQLLENEDAFSFEETRQLALSITQRLQAIHEAGFVHGDLKPDNVLIGKDLHPVWLSDFGSADASQNTTRYAAPEQIDRADSDHRADLFSLGVILYEMVAGHPPFQSTRSETLAKEITLMPAPPLENAVCPRWYQDLLSSSLEKEPRLRPESAKEVVDALTSSRFGSRHDFKKWLLIGSAFIAMVLGAAAWMSSPKQPLLPLDPAVSIVGEPGIYSTLADAVAAAPPNAVVELQDGVHELGAEVRIRKPIKIVAAKGARPLIRRRKDSPGWIFRLDAPVILERLTLSDHLTVSASHPLIRASAPLTAIRCRFEQIRQASPASAPFPSVIQSTSKVTLERTEIDATSGCVLTSYPSATEPAKEIILKSCAIAAVRGFFFGGKGAERPLSISLTNCHIVAGGVFCFGKENQSAPHWTIERCIIDGGRMFMIRGPWNRFAEEVLSKASWQGHGNVYALTEFLYPWAGDLPNGFRKSLADWRALCPQAEEIDTLESAEPLILSFLPKDHRDLRSKFSRMPPFHAKDLQIRPQMAAQFPGRGGDMSRVGPDA